MFHSTQKSPVAYYFIYILACVRVSTLSSISYNTIVTVPLREARSGIFDHEFTVQTFKYLLACLIPSRKVLLYVILYIHLHAYVPRLKAAFHTILLSLYMCVKLEAEFSTIKFTVQTFKYLLACFIPPRKVLLHIILYIHLHAYVCRIKAAFHTILLSLYLCEKRETEISTINLRSNHSNTCLHVSFHPEKSCCILFYIYTCMRTCVYFKQHFIQYYCPCTCA